MEKLPKCAYVYVIALRRAAVGGTSGGGTIWGCNHPVKAKRHHDNTMDNTCSCQETGACNLLGTDEGFLNKSLMVICPEPSCDHYELINGENTEVATVCPTHNFRLISKL